jgi:hypothetical protein
MYLHNRGHGTTTRGEERGRGGKEVAIIAVSAVEKLSQFQQRVKICFCLYFPCCIISDILQNIIKLRAYNAKTSQQNKKDEGENCAKRCKFSVCFLAN